LGKRSHSRLSELLKSGCVAQPPRLRAEEPYARLPECHVVVAVVRERTDPRWPHPQGPSQDLVIAIRGIELGWLVKTRRGIVDLVANQFQGEQHFMLLRKPRSPKVHSVIWDCQHVLARLARRV